MKHTTNNQNPLVSVILPAYNAEGFLEAAVRSVMAQTVQNWELIILDDGSQDATCTIAQRLAEEDERILFSPNGENMGVARTRNRGIAMSRGAYVALLDSDDLWQPDKLEKQLARLEQTGADICYTAYAIIGLHGEKVRPDYLVPEQATFQKLLKENVIGCSTVLLRGEVARANPFKTEFSHEDYVLWLQLLQAGYKAAGCTEVLTQWRYLDGSRSFNKKKAARNRWRIYREYLHLNFFRSGWLMGHYVAASLKKYLRRGK